MWFKARSELLDSLRHKAINRAGGETAGIARGAGPARFPPPSASPAISPYSDAAKPAKAMNAQGNPFNPADFGFFRKYSTPEVQIH
jgi:hypothetical protein